MSRAIGPDISFYQDDNNTLRGVDFDVMRDAPSHFVHIRVGQNNWLDSDFKTHWENAKKAGLARGSYWFYDSRSTPQSQAQRWADALGNDQGELPLFADYEENYGGPYGSAWHFHTFLKELATLMPEKEIMIYTGYYFWEDRVLPQDRYLFAPYGLWIARYSDSEPWIPEPWEYDKWDFWQNTSHGPGLKYGVESLNIDLNYYNGTPEEFKERFGLGVVDPDPDPDPPIGDDMLELLERIAVAEERSAAADERIADAIENLDMTGPGPDPGTDPTEATWTLQSNFDINGTGNHSAIGRREPNTQDSNKIAINFQPGETVVETMPPPKTVYPTGGTKIWTTEAELENVLKHWAYLLDQPVVNANGVSRMLLDYKRISGSGEFGPGMFVERKYLK